MGYTDFSGVRIGGVPVVPGLGSVPFTGNYFYVDPVTGADGNPGTADLPLATLYQAHNKATAGNNDVIFLVGDGGTTATARLSLANAQTIDSAATSGKLTWSKNATHLVGLAAPTGISQRARIAPPTGTYTASTFGDATMVNVTASGCMFANFSLWGGFSTGSTSAITWIDAGARNYYGNVHIGGLADAASAGAAACRTIKISGSGEHTFEGCTFGVDTVTRTAANATVEFSGGTTRNVFRNCLFPFMTSAATPLGVIVSAAAGSDRFQLFDRCLFINAVKSTSTTMSALSTLAASMGGMHVYKDCTLVGITEFGSDATSLAQIFVDGAAPTAATSGIAVAPS